MMRHIACVDIASSKILNEKSKRKKHKKREWHNKIINQREMLHLILTSSNSSTDPLNTFIKYGV